MVHNEATTFSTSRLSAERMRDAHTSYLAELHADVDVMAMIGGVRTAESERNLACWTEAATAIVATAREHYALDQLGAITLTGNDASSRVLMKCGFGFERMVTHPVGPHRFFRLTF